jgi:hypothetical protein
VSHRTPLTLALVLAPAAALAGPREANMAEPILGETVTDIDGRDAGEIEIDMHGIVPHVRGTTWAVGEVGVEARVTRRLGVELEGAIAGWSGVGGRGDVLARGSFMLYHGTRHDLHVQLEARAGVDYTLGTPTFPSSEGAAFAIGARVGYRTGWLVLRGGAGAAISDEGHAPIWADLAAFVQLGHAGSFAGIETTTDWTSATPAIVCPEVELSLGDVKLALGAPIFLGNPTTGVYAGGLVALIIELDDD